MKSVHHLFRALHSIFRALHSKTLSVVIFAVFQVFAQGQPVSLALSARASAFETYQNLVPELANDGRPDTRWSGIPGHNSGGWYELDWACPVRAAQVVVVQYDRYVNEMDLQVWDDSSQIWQTLRHFGRPGQKLPKVVEWRFAPLSCSKLRLANITGGPSFTEVQVFEKPFSPPPQIVLASDANGNFIGVVADGWGGVPLGAVEVSLSGEAGAGQWEAKARSDSNGLFFAPMPLGMSGQVSASALPSPDRDWAVTH